jgi:hypothetical protein
LRSVEVFVAKKRSTHEIILSPFEPAISNMMNRTLAWQKDKFTWFEFFSV